MTVKIFTDGLGYVKALYDIEEQATKGPITFTSSFLSSIYFPKHTIERFYSNSPTDEMESCETLVKRQQIVLDHLNKIPRKEIYEAEVFTKILSQGIVHEQEPSYRVCPSELRETLKNILQLLIKYPSFEIAITSEVLPMVFTLVPPSTVIIDIRINYTYQKIQGQLIEGDEAIFQVFTDEFSRLWESPRTISKKQSIIDLLTKSLDQWDKGENIDLSCWPTMKKTDRRE